LGAAGGLFDDDALAGQGRGERPTGDLLLGAEVLDVLLDRLLFHLLLAVGALRMLEVHVDLLDFGPEAGQLLIGLPAGEIIRPRLGPGQPPRAMGLDRREELRLRRVLDPDHPVSSIPWASFAI